MAVRAIYVRYGHIFTRTINTKNFLNDFCIIFLFTFSSYLEVVVITTHLRNVPIRGAEISDIILLMRVMVSK